MRLVVALGGNAIAAPGTKGDIAHQFERSRLTARLLADLGDDGHEVTVTHGNGPQVGNIMLRVELASRSIYSIPLALAVADTQAGMGYMIAQCLMNELAARGRPRLVSTLVTTVEVDPDDPAFADPTKPVGGWYTAEQAVERRERDGWSVREVEAGRWRRVVPSPRPRAIVEMALIRRLVDAGEMLVCCGGGGIPVWRDREGLYGGVDAVIDKDLTAALLASGVGADRLLIATGAQAVFEAWGSPEQRAIEEMTAAEARRRLADGAFPPGSMGPKVEAAALFCERSERPGSFAVIGSLESLADAAEGRVGTRVVPG